MIHFGGSPHGPLFFPSSSSPEVGAAGVVLFSSFVAGVLVVAAAVPVSAPVGPSFSLLPSSHAEPERKLVTRL